MRYEILVGDVMEKLGTLADESVHCVVTSPPYWGLRNYGVDGQIGLEKTPNCGAQGKWRIKRGISIKDSMELLGHLLAMRSTSGEEARQGDVRQMLQETVRCESSSAETGVAESVLPPQPGGIQQSNQNPSKGKASRNDSGVGRKVRVLRRDGGNISVPGSHQARRETGIQEGGRASRSMEESDSGGLTQGEVPDIVLELQFGSGLVRLLSSLIFDVSQIPTPAKEWFEPAACGECYICKMTVVFREIRRVLRSDGTCWVNMGDSYAGSGRGGNTSDTSGLEGTTESQEQARKARGSILPAGIHANAVASGAIGRAWVAPPAGLKQKDLVGMPWRLAFALQADGWWLRQDIIWSKPNPMPESVTDRCTKAHEYLFLLTKSGKYFYDAEAIKEPANGWNGSEFHDGKNLEIHPNVGKNRASRSLGDKMTEADEVENRAAVGSKMGRGAGWRNDPANSPATRNKRSVWEIATEAFPEAHFATFPTKLVEPCILAGTSEKGCCEDCGAPWARMVETTRSNQSGSGRADNIPEGKLAGGTQVREDHDIRMGPTTSTETIGWKPSCKCSAPTTPCTVLDCFNGSGTTGLVALANRCNYIGIELNPEYAAMSERRLAAATAQGVLV